MHGGPERTRAFAVVTALLDEDFELAKKLISEDEDPQALAWGASTIAAGLWEHHVALMGQNPQEAWATSLLRLNQRKG